VQSILFRRASPPVVASSVRRRQCIPSRLWQPNDSAGEPETPPTLRVSQKVSDGEFWVSSTVRDMMLGGSTTFTDRGQHTLKGFDEPWRLYSVGGS